MKLRVEVVVEDETGRDDGETLCSAGFFGGRPWSEYGRLQESSWCGTAVLS